MGIFVHLPKLNAAASIDDWTQAVAEQNDVDEAIVDAIVTEVRGSEADPTTKTETPWDSESSGMTYMWPANEHGDF